MSVPFIDLKRFESGLLDQWSDRFTELLSQAQFIGGPEVSTLEMRLQELLGVRHAITCANGTDALQLALRALNIGPGDVVLVPDMTFWATFEAVVNVGATPMTVDISLDDGGLCIQSLESAIEMARPKAAIAAHLFGWGSGRLDDIRRLCKQHGIDLIEDGAQCLGTGYQQRPIYEGALISTTSFYPAKVLGAAGDGGAVFTQDPDLAARVRRLSNHGRTSHYGYEDVGWNSRLDTLQAAFLNLSLPHLSARIASRKACIAYYQQHLPCAELSVLAAPADYAENGYCNVCLIPNPEIKARVEASLRSAQIGFGNIYPSPISTQPGAKPHLGGHFGGRNAHEWCRMVLNLPLFPYMTETELAQVVHHTHQGVGL